MKREDVARMRPRERKALLEEIAAMVAAGELGLGDAARLLRAAVLGMNRAAFSAAVGISERALAKLEDDPDANPTLETLARVFAPFGGKISLVFPRMEEPEPPSEETRQRREMLLTALERTRRRRAQPAPRR